MYRPSKEHLYRLYDVLLPYEAETILELGSRRASIDYWKALYPNSLLVAVDLGGITPHRGGVIAIQGDVRDDRVLDRIKTFAPFDLIIDDADHFRETQKLLFDNLYPCLREGGMYIIEDVLVAPLIDPAINLMVSYGPSNDFVKELGMGTVYHSENPASDVIVVRK